MTPPDSGDTKKRTPEEWQKLAEEEQRGTEQGLAFLDAVERDGCMAKVKPDSGEREVCGYFEKDEGWDSRWDAHSRRRCWLARGHALPHDYAPVSLPLSLAQRILAALEGFTLFDDDEVQERKDLITLLCARMPKGTR